MWKDPIVEETRKLREQYASKHNHDIDAIFEDIQQRQAKSDKKCCHFRHVSQLKRQMSPNNGSIRSF